MDAMVEDSSIEDSPDVHSDGSMADSKVDAARVDVGVDGARVDVGVDGSRVDAGRDAAEDAIRDVSADVADVADGETGRAAPMVATGTYHTLLLHDGIVWAFGSNRAGQLGVGLSAGATTARPMQVRSVNVARDVVAVAAGGYQSLALTRQGRVWSWGANEAGQRGDGSPITDLNGNGQPVMLPSFGVVSAISSGGRHNLALTRDGKVYAWGANDNGQVGDGGPVRDVVCEIAVGNTPAMYHVTKPTMVALPVAIRQISAGYCTSFALDENGDVWSWGFGDYLSANLAQQGVTAAAVSTPGKVRGLTNVVELAAGQGCHYARRSDGTVWSWGVNRLQCLGNGATSPAATPVQVAIDGVVSLVAGNATGYARKADGSVLAWGYSSHGELGDGTSVDLPKVTNQVVSAPRPVTIVGARSAVRLFSASSSTFAFAVRADGSVWSWGRNKSGNLGNGRVGDDTSDDSTPDDENVATPTQVFPPFPTP